MICLSLSLSIYLPIYLSIYLSTYLPIYLSTYRVFQFCLEAIGPGPVADVMVRMYLLGVPYAVALTHVMRAAGVHGSALMVGNPPIVPNIGNMRNSLGDLFDNSNGELSVFASMLGRYVEDLFGYSPPYSKPLRPKRLSRPRMILRMSPP